MSSDKTRLEIGHFLFIDIVGYSKLLVKQQSELLRELNEVVSETKEFREADSAEKLIRLPTGDGMALVFRTNMEAPVECAMEIARALKSHPAIPLRMGIHSGPVSEVVDVNQRANVAGGGINMAKRVMDCGDAGHILLSKHVAEDLEQEERWRPLLHDLGECEVKHGKRIGVTNLYSDEVGNPRLPTKLQAVRKHRARVRWAEIALGLFVLGAIVAATLLFFRRPVRSALAIAEKSIAVLPFENLSEDKANAYFADGIQDEILTRLSKIADLKVISRTSTQQYKSAPGNLPEIARQLGVAHIVEGSVQKSGDAVRVNVQLIRAANESHLWADTFDGKLTDIFSVETEVAKAIADQLRAKLIGQEEQVLAAKPTNNPEAYDAYLRGLAFSERSGLLEADVAKATQLFETAVSLDPKFALAWARLSKMHSIMFAYSDASTARRDAAYEALQKAFQLQPDLLDAQLAEGYYNYRVIHDFDHARKIFEQLRSKWPNNSEVPRMLALVARRQGRWDESLARFREALELDPRNLQTLIDASGTAKWMRQYQMAFQFIDRALDIAPTDNSALALKTGIYQALGQLDQADAVLARMQKEANDELAIEALAQQCQLRHDYPSGVALIQSTLAKLDPSLRSQHAQWLAWLGGFQHLAGDEDGAKSSYSQSCEELKNLLRVQPDNPWLMSRLAFAIAGLGDKEGALQLQKQALDKVNAENDLVARPAYEEGLAQLQAQAGLKDRAITALQHLLTTNGATITPALLRLNPDWDELRNDPRFQVLVVDQVPEPTSPKP
jgi:TolB-like protein/Tfp pilus assembly protein PilF